MRKFHSEFAHNYKKYSFGYALHALREKNDTLSDIYKEGFLPYTGSHGTKDLFYMARSARVPLRDFSLSSENRRVAKKFDGSFVRGMRSVDDFRKDEDAFSFCLSYFEKKHGAGVMPRERLETILQSDLLQKIVVYQSAKEKTLVAYVFEVSDPSMSHFWFSFYDLAYARQSLGMWLMLDSAREAQKRGSEHFYVGTVYNAKALYKTAFENLEYWNGSRWCRDTKGLKARSKSDEGREISLSDLWTAEQKKFLP